MNILNYLDKELENFKQKTGSYPTKIIMNIETKKKIFDSLESGIDIKGSWVDKQDNYRGIKLKIGKEERITLL
jgi:hypothetical protein